jgi:predicted Fe-Mo cluster-binding NifX family protein
MEELKMTIAIAATAPELNGQIAMHGARAPFYLLFDEQGNMLEVLANPVVQAEGGAASQAALFLADKGVTLLAAGDFGSRFVSELEEKGIDHVQMSGLIADVIVELIS